MRSRRRIAWTLEVPVEGVFPERTLRQMIKRVEDEQPRLAALTALDELDAARKAITDAAGDAERLDRAMRDLNSTFTRLTGTDSTRRAGEMYAGRTFFRIA